MQNSNKTPIEKAVWAVGTKTELAKRVGCSPQNITNMKYRKGRIPGKTPEKRALWVKATGLTEEELFPDIGT